MKLTLPPKIGWILYECPNLVWFIIYLPQIKFDIQRLPIILFVIHYFNRVVIYPLRYKILFIIIRLSKHARPIPLEVVASAFLFTTCNGYLQITSNLNSESNL